VKPDAIGMLGLCSGAGYSAKAAAVLPELKALVTIAGFYHDPAVFRTGSAPTTMRAWRSAGRPASSMRPPARSTT
jgi:dienelactone hydrolase